jgi:hypothetical protein
MNAVAPLIHLTLPTYALLAIATLSIHAATPRPGDGASIQSALDAHPGLPIDLPAGIYEIDRPIRITTDGSGLVGHGTIIQTNKDAAILLIEGADHVRIEGITLQRRHQELGKDARGIRAENAHHLRIANVSVFGNRAKTAAVRLLNCDYPTMESCSVVDYKTIAVDNRMKDDLYRYAFNAIDGHGILMTGCIGPRLLRNRVIETELIPTPEVKKRHDLGKMVDRAEKLGELASYGVSADGFVFIWHQGAAVSVNQATRTAFALIEGNHIENGAQGMDLHGDFMIVTNNHVTNCYMGMKAFHGARGVIISNNIFHKPGKYGILLRPGSNSSGVDTEGPGSPVGQENVERGIIIANNIITDQGYGHESWRLWNSDPSETAPVGIKIGTGPMEINPRLMDLIIEGNMIYDRGRDLVMLDGKAVDPGPRYKWAIWFDDEWRVQNVKMANNIFHPGEKGVSNLPIEP